jgi:hypothetical protein
MPIFLEKVEASLSKNRPNPAEKELYETVSSCFDMIQTHSTQRLANHKLNELVEEHGKEKIVELMEKVKRKRH